MSNPLIYLDTVQKRLGLDHCTGCTELIKSVLPSHHNTAVFVVPVSEAVFRSGAYDYTQIFFESINATHGTTYCDTLTVHGFEYEHVPVVAVIDPVRPQTTIELTRVTIHYSLSESEERAHLMKFISELNSLQTRYGYSIEPDTPMLVFVKSRLPANRSLMSIENGRITISSPWGG